MNVLVLCDDLWHPGEVVELGLAPLAEEFNFTFVRDAKDILTPEFIAPYPVIMNCKSNNIGGANTAPWFDEGVTEVGARELAAYVEKGGGLLSVHSGNAFHPGDTSGYPELVGNYFVGHPPRCDIKVKITARHPVTEGVNDFTIRDEHYALDIVADDLTELFRTESESGGDQVGGYVRFLGKGRIVMLTPGHILAVWHHPAYARMLCNAIRWCAGES